MHVQKGEARYGRSLAALKYTRKIVMPIPRTWQIRVLINGTITTKLLERFTYVVRELPEDDERDDSPAPALAGERSLIAARAGNGAF